MPYPHGWSMLVISVYSQGFVGWPISSQHAHCFGRGIHLCHERVQRIALRSDRNGSRSGDTWLFFHAPRRGYVLQLEMGDGSPFYGHFTGENEVSSILGCNGDLNELTSYEPVNFRFFCFRLWLLLRSFFTSLSWSSLLGDDQKSGQGRYL